MTENSLNDYNRNLYSNESLTNNRQFIYKKPQINFEEEKIEDENENTINYQKIPKFDEMNTEDNINEDQSSESNTKDDNSEDDDYTETESEYDDDDTEFDGIKEEEEEYEDEEENNNNSQDFKIKKKNEDFEVNNNEKFYFDEKEEEQVEVMQKLVEENDSFPKLRFDETYSHIKWIIFPDDNLKSLFF